jgi:hypothetical protein
MSPIHNTRNIQLEVVTEECIDSHAETKECSVSHYKNKQRDTEHSVVSSREILL